MPLFEFTCKKCGHQFEELVTLSELNDGKLVCPACRSKRIERGFSAFATGGDTGGGAVGGGGCGSGGFT
ncbi:FmdB family transcriptional regulator [bacterium DOLJORAL78_65_58]|nr:MAG: FmdB family transcriptional regulator [bacterium DOLZORAL124_64_63]PIE75787.1 MAG: FmdB family transcriptional regulator [bacterium DOLJORAL78_65_58]